MLDFSDPSVVNSLSPTYFDNMAFALPLHIRLMCMKFNLILFAFSLLAICSSIIYLKWKIGRLLIELMRDQHATFRSRGVIHVDRNCNLVIMFPIFIKAPTNM